MSRTTSIVAFALAACVSGGAFADLIMSTWVGPAAGNWNVAANWSPVVVPHNSGGNTYIAHIDNNSRQNTTVTHTTGTTALVGLIIDAGDALIQNNNTTFDLIEFVTNDGLWQMNSTVNLTDIRLNGPEVTFDGGGVLSMTNTLTNRIYGIGAQRRLINGPDHTIRGSAHFGAASNFKFTNHGLIDANQTAEILIQPTGGAGNFNDGIMQASGNGVLRNVAHIDNTDGLIRAIGNGLVRLESGTTIVGGELRTEDSGEMRIQAGQTVALQNATINGTLTQQNNSFADITGDIVLNGQWLLNSTVNLTDIRLFSDVTLLGDAEVVTTNTLNNRIYGVGGLRRLTIPEGNVIRGSGHFGAASNFKFTNHGLIDANQTAEILIQPTGGAGNFNDGVIQARSNGTVRTIAHIDNTGGVIRAIESGLVRMENGTTIVGGELRTEDDGEMRIQAGQTVALQNATINGTLTQQNNSFADITGDIVLNGQWLLNSTVNLTDIRLFSDVTLLGDAEVVTTNTLNNRIYGVGGLRRLTIPEGNVIRGSGHFGAASNFKFTNHGLIDANQSAEFLIQPTGGPGNLNDGVIQARNNATVRTIAHIDNTDGLIRAIGSGLVRLDSGTTIVGGELRTEDSGELRIQAGHTVAFQNATINGTLTQQNNSFADITGDIEVNGQWLINGTINLTGVRLFSDVTLLGDAEVVMSNTPNNRWHGVGAVRHLTIQPGATVRGSGQLGVASNFRLTSHGSLIADQSAGITVHTTGGQTFLNTGLIHVTGDGAMTIQSPPFSQQGEVVIDAGRTLTRMGNYPQAGAASSTVVNGTLSLTNNGILQLQGGTLRGAGQVTGPVQNTGGAVNPGNSVGQLHVQGTYTQTGDGRLVIEIDGQAPVTGHDLLSVSGAASVGGRFEPIIDPDFAPAPGTQVTFLTANSVSGTFNFGAPCNGVKLVYGANSVALEFTGVNKVGDLNCDGVVGVADLLILLAAWGQCLDPEDCPADLGGDGVVGVADLLALLAHWG